MPAVLTYYYRKLVILWLVPEKEIQLYQFKISITSQHVLNLIVHYLKTESMALLTVTLSQAIISTAICRLDALINVGVVMLLASFLLS